MSKGGRVGGLQNIEREEERRRGRERAREGEEGVFLTALTPS